MSDVFAADDPVANGTADADADSAERSRGAVDTTPPVALTIAGSDSGGGAGIQADLRTFAAFGVHGCTAVAALTAQNTHEVRSVVATDPGFLRDQIEAVLDDLPVAAVKTGMLATAANVRVVAELAAAGRLPNLVVDPVMVSSSGDRLLDDDAVDAYRHELLPHALVTTPNGREAIVLAGGSAAEGLHPNAIARRLLALGPRVVVVTGGDAGADRASDVAVWLVSDVDLHAESDLAFEVDYDDVLVHALALDAPLVVTVNNHGTGCSFASAIVAQLATGAAPLEAIAGAKRFVHDAITRAAAWHLGAGHGPIDHLDFAHPSVHPSRRTTN